MKKSIVILMIIVLVACSTEKTKVMILSDGQVITIDKQFPTNVGDTIVIKFSSDLIPEPTMYGKYIGKLPTAYGSLSYYDKAVVIK